MIGTLVNTAAVAAGALLGLSAGKRLPTRFQQTLSQALGLSVIYLGIKMSLEGSRALLVIACVLAGGLTGEILRIEQALERLAGWLKQVLGSASPSFVQGFVAASLMYLVGPLTILGCLDDGALGMPEKLYIKSIFDGVASVVLASSLGVGVFFSAFSVFIVQSLLSLGAGYMLFLRNPAIISAITSTGGVLILGIGLSIMEIKKIPTGNLLPALLYAVLAAAFL